MSPRSVVRTSLFAFCSCLLVLTLLGWGIPFVNSYFLHRGYPYNTPLFNPALRFTDLTDFTDRVQNLAAGGRILFNKVPPFNYSPPALYIDAFFILMFRNPAAALVSFYVAIAILGLLVLRAALRGSALPAQWINFTLLVTALCSFPFAIAIDRGNI